MMRSSDEDPDLAISARKEDGMPPRLHESRVDLRPDRDDLRCCRLGRVTYDCTCSYRTHCQRHGTECHGTHD